MSGRARKKAPAGRVNPSSERLEKNHFQVNNHIPTIKFYSSTPKTKQQTLTQIDFVKRYDRNEDEADLDYIDEDAPKPSKRRRLMVEPNLAKKKNVIPRVYTPQRKASNKEIHASLDQGGKVPAKGGDCELERPQKWTMTPEVSCETNVITRASKRKSLQRGGSVEFIGEALPNHPTKKIIKESESQRSQIMPPPQTPKTARKTEIPSSQSPLDTPLSFRSQASCRSYSRSPLKPISANALTMWPTSRNRLREPKLEITDSMGSENDEPPLSAAVSAEIRIQRCLVGIRKRSAKVSDMQRSLMLENEGNSRRQLSNPQKPEIKDSMESSSTPSRTPRSEISNRESIKSQSELEVANAEDNYLASVETQAVLSSLETNSDDLSSDDHEVQIDKDIRPRSTQGTVNIAIQSSRKRQPEKNEEYGTDFDAQSSPSAVIARNNANPRKVSQKGKIKDTNSTQLLSENLRFRRSDLDEESAQLESALKPLIDLLPTQETESQVERGQRDFSAFPNQGITRSLPRDRSKEPVIEQDISSLDLPPPVRSSQATTVDITQFSPDVLRARQQNFTSSYQPLNFEVPPSSLALIAPYSSSPSKEVAERMVWNGEPLTDSQLLPESLMNDSLPAPPLSTQESLDEA